jgi:hypothetical protein
MKNFIIALLFVLSSAVYADPWERTDAHSIEIQKAFQRSDEWSKQERIAFTLSIVAHAADLYTSLNSNHDPSRGPYCRETNPLLGDNPSVGALVGVKLIAIGLEYWIYSNPRFNSHNTHWYGYASAAIHGYAAYSNTQNDCYGVD